MGWHSFGERDQAITGDAPIDAVSTAMERIAAAYLDRFGRLPMLAEVLHALRVVLEAKPDELLFDPETIENHPPVAPLPEDAPLDLDRFQAAWAERPQPHGAYYVSARATGKDVLRCSIRIEHRTLVVDYESLQPDLSADDSRRLILHTLIRELLGDTYEGSVDDVSIAAVSSPTSRTLHRYRGRNS